MSKRITKFEAQLVTFESTLDASEVLTRLDKELNRSQGPFSIVDGVGSREEIEARVNGSITEGNDFAFFSGLSHDRWLNVFFATDRTPVTHLYTLGNPLVAETILQHDLRAALHIPPRLLVLEKEDHSGTKIIYLLPSSVMVLGDNAALREAAGALDMKLEGFVTKILRV